VSPRRIPGSQIEKINRRDRIQSADIADVAVAGSRAIPSPSILYWANFITPATADKTSR
jgi:hypothetical protein